MANERGTEETARKTEGISLRFSNPEALRAYILSPEKPGKTTLAERIAGIREIPLGEFGLDGQLFQSIRFTLVVEPDRDPRGQKPTVIIRADLALGPADTALTQFQTAKASGEKPPDYFAWDGKLAQEIKKIFPGQEDTDNDQAYFSYVQWTNNTTRFSLYRNNELLRDIDREMPLALLQIWDQDAGYGSISMSLLSWRYATEWDNRSLENQAAELERQIAKGSVSDDYLGPVVDEVDRWQFAQPVGIDVYDPQRFAAALAFYQEALVGTIQAIYQTEGFGTEHLHLVIEPPVIFKENEKITFADVGGQAEAVAFLQNIVASEKARQLLTNRLILLAGPPGNGKTTLAQAAANELDAPLLVATTRSLPPQAQEADFVNLLEAGYLQAKAAARTSGCQTAIYLLENLERILGENPRLQDYFINTLDAWQNDPAADVIVIATSNEPHRLHPAIIDRFRRVEVPQPARSVRAQILEALMLRLERQTGKKGLFQIDLQELARLTEDMSGRQLLKLLSEAYTRRTGRPIDTEFVKSLIPPKPKLGF